MAALPAIQPWITLAPRETRALAWPELEALLPDGGLPRGVIELSASRALGGASSIAARAVASAHAKDERAWCAWIDPEATLHAPGLHTRDVDLARLLVVRPARVDAERVALKCASSGAFEVIVLDLDPVGGAGTTARRRKDALFVRKLALGAERSGATVILLVDADAKKHEPWPVALRLELEREPGALFVRVGKDRHGRASPQKSRIRLELFGHE